MELSVFPNYVAHPPSKRSRINAYNSLCFWKDDYRNDPKCSFSLKIFACIPASFPYAGCSSCEEKYDNIVSNNFKQ
jgi:hypothetical protein